MIDFNNLNLLTGAFISGELQKQGYTPEEAAKIYIQERSRSRSPQAAAGFDEKAAGLSPVLSEFKDITPDEIQGLQGADIIGEEVEKRRSYDDRRGDNYKSEFSFTKRIDDQSHGIAARADAIKRIKIGLGILPQEGSEVISIAPEDRDAALRLLGDMELRQDPKQQIELEKSGARAAVRQDVNGLSSDELKRRVDLQMRNEFDREEGPGATVKAMPINLGPQRRAEIISQLVDRGGVISREGETRSAQTDNLVRQDDNREPIGGNRKFQVSSNGEIGFRRSAPTETALIRSDGVPVDAGTRDPIMSESIMRLGEMLDPDSVRQVPTGSAAEFILNSYQNSYDTSAETSFSPFAVDTTLDDLTELFEAKGASIGRPIRTAADLEEISSAFVAQSNKGRRGSDRFWTYDPTSNVQRLNTNPGVEAVMDKLRIRGGRRRTIARALYEQELGMAQGSPSRNVEAIRARANSVPPNLYQGAEAAVGSTQTESYAVGPTRMVSAATPGAQKIEGDNVTDALGKISVERSRRDELDRAIQAEEEFQGRELTPQERQEAVGGIKERFLSEDREMQVGDVNSDARMPLIGAVAGESSGGSRDLSALYIPPEGRTTYKSGKPRQSPENQALGERLNEAIKSARAERQFLAQMEAERRGPFEVSGQRRTTQSAAGPAESPDSLVAQARSRRAKSPAIELPTSDRAGSEAALRRQAPGANKEQFYRGGRSPVVVPGGSNVGREDFSPTVDSAKPSLAGKINTLQAQLDMVDTSTAMGRRTAEMLLREFRTNAANIPPAKATSAVVNVPTENTPLTVRGTWASKPQPEEQSAQQVRPTPARSFGTASTSTNDIVSLEGRARRRRPSTINTTAKQGPREPNFGDTLKNYMTNNDKEYGDRYRKGRRIGGYSALGAGGLAAIGGLIAGERERRQEETVR